MPTFTKIIFFLYVILFPLGQFVRIPAHFGGFIEVNIYLTDIVIGIAALVWVSQFFILRFPTPPFFREFTAFFGTAIFSLFLAFDKFNYSEIFASSLYLLRFLCYFIFFFFICQSVKKGIISQKVIKESLLAIGFFISLSGWVQYFIFPDLRPYISFGWDEHYARIFGTFLDPGFTAILMTLFLLLLLEEIFKLRPKKDLALFSVLVSSWIIGFFALFLTYSRSGYLAFIIGTYILAKKRARLRVFYAILALIIITVILLPKPGGEGVKLERTSTIFTRIQNWVQTFSIGSSSPLFGVGFDTLRYFRLEKGLLNKEDFYSHSAAGADSSILFVFATTGIVGIIAYLSLIFNIGRKYRNFLPSLVAILVHSLFANTLFYPWVMGWLALLFSTKNLRKK